MMDGHRFRHRTYETRCGLSRQAKSNAVCITRAISRVPSSFLPKVEAKTITGEWNRKACLPDQTYHSVRAVNPTGAAFVHKRHITAKTRAPVGLTAVRVVMVAPWAITPEHRSRS